MKLHPTDRDYPDSLLALEQPPVLTVSGPLAPSRVVAIVGSREADRDAVHWAEGLAYHLARAGIVVASGGAVGIDKAAHEGAMRGGATWVVACTGRTAEPFPDANKDLFEEVERSESSRMIWPFPDPKEKTVYTPRQRNSVLIALASYVVVIQARAQSGSRNAAWWANHLARPLYVVPGRPWDLPFLGSTELLLNGAAPLFTIEQLMRALDLPEPDMSDPLSGISGTVPRSPPIRRIKKRGPPRVQRPLFDADKSTYTGPERIVISKLSRAPTQQDKIVAMTGLGASATLTALLTLSLRDVVVEGPDGFFRSRN